jgi:hypothetical protein
MDQILILWSEGGWRCELYPAAGHGALLKIYQGDDLIVIESTEIGPLAFRRCSESTGR